MRGEPVTITDERMTRFVMTIQEAAKLVLEAAMLACGGEILVTKMPVMRIIDLAQAMIEILAPISGLYPDEIPLQDISEPCREKSSMRN